MAIDAAAAQVALSMIDGPGTGRQGVAMTLSHYGAGVLRYARERDIRIRILAKGETFIQASPEMTRLDIDADAWSAPPAGMFVVNERTVYLRSRSAMTVAHEFGHALDCALGGGVYRSGIDPDCRALFVKARSFLTPYAATGLDEFLAEAFRAWMDHGNDASSSWPRATRERLERIDPRLYGYVSMLMRDMGYPERPACETTSIVDGRMPLPFVA
jgi:hypothetical protein